MTDKNQITLTINDKQVRVPHGTTLMKAAFQAGIEIPNLCHHESLPPAGSCRVCIVEISNPSRNPENSWIDSACVCTVSEGIAVRTDSPRVIRERKLILSLLLSKAPDSPRIRMLAEEYGISENRFSSEDSGKSNCILCGLCVRVCNELIEANAIGTSGRGVYKMITSPYMAASELCIGCLACEQVCPTGVIKFDIEDKKLKKEDWGVALEMIFCPDCGEPVGTHIQMKKIKEKTTVTDDFLYLCPACRRKKNYSVKTVLHQHRGV